MKRGMLGRMMMICGLAIAVPVACSPAPPQQRPEPAARAAPAWSRPPVILSVRMEGTNLIFTGAADPGARVVLRSGSGAAHAAAADDQGRFEIRMAAPQDDQLLSPEIQVGQDTAPAPDRLLILAGGRGPIAVLRAGGPTRRLDDAPTLGAIDSDGRARLASGRSPTPKVPVEIVAGGQTLRVTPDAAGRWNAMLGQAGDSGEVRVDGRTYIWPGAGAAGTELHVERAGQGWRVGWSGPANARQITWLPDPRGERR